MEDVPDLGPVPKRIHVEADVVRRLVAERFPQWATLPITPVRHGGWDNQTFHLGDSMLVRLPTAAEYALAVEKETRWLPVLASHVTLPIPEPVGTGRPNAEYPFPWSVNKWLAGERATVEGIVDQVEFGTELADFIRSLRAVDASEGPRPGIHNWHRGGTLRTFDGAMNDALSDLAGHVDPDLMRQIWANALSSRWDGVDEWFHGDLAEGNLLMRDGRLSAVIDFGTCGVGDPSCDLAIAWTMLNPLGREAFRERLRVDDASWARGRGWALWKTLSQFAGAVEDGDERGIAVARRTIDQIVTDYGG